MRRLTFAAIAATLILAACSDQGRESPTEPSQPAPDALSTCRPVLFPLVKVSAQILRVFPAGKLRVEAVARAAIIAGFWDTCKRAPAQKAAIAFIDWMNSNSAKLIGTQDQRNTLVNLILNGVGIPGSVPPTASTDFGVGFFDPTSNQPLKVTTVSKTALTEIPAHAFSEPMIIKVARKLDAENLSNAGDVNQFPPAWDYDAVRSSGVTGNSDHLLQNGSRAAIVFCLLNSDFVSYPANRGIGHNPVEGAPGFPFEILEPIDLVNDRPDLAAALNCPSLAPNTAIIGGLGKGFPGLANAFLRAAGHSLNSVAEAIFLPQPVEATTMGTLPPPIGGRAPSLTPFKVVEVGSEDAGVISNGTLSLGVNPTGNLVIPDPGAAVPGIGSTPLGVGLRFGSAEALAIAIPTEGWGFGDAAGGTVGFVDLNEGPPVNLTVESFQRTATEATSVVRVGEAFRVTHHFSSVSPNLYEVEITTENISGLNHPDLRYRRVMDWDIPPTAFSEFVTVAGIATTPGVSASNNNYQASANPQSALGGSATGDFSSGPGDLGTVFDVAFGLAAGASKTFRFYYGAAGTFSDARSAAVSKGLEVVTLARPSTPALDGTPNTFIGGFKNLGGTALTADDIPLVNPPVLLLRQMLRLHPSGQGQQQQR
jgi:hypothetical protein